MDKGFEKIELETGNVKTKSVEGTTDNIEMLKTPKGQNKKPRKIFKIAGILLIFIVISLLISIIPAINLYKQVKRTESSGKKVVQAVKNQDLDSTQKELENTLSDLKQLKKNYGFFKFTKLIPFVSGYYKDGEYALNSVEAGLEGGKIAVDALIPYADLLGLKGQSTFTAGSADERIQTAVKTFDKLTPKIGEIADKIEVVNRNLNQIKLNRYPEKIGDKEFRGKLIEVRKTIDISSQLFVNAQGLLVKLPKLLGEPEPKKYLVIFQNDKELRPTGGFITAYAVFKIEKGKMLVETSDDIYKLDEKNSTKLVPPKPFAQHLKVFQLHLRDANYDPDFIDSMKRFEDIYQKIPGTIKIDGIIAVDTHVLVEAMKILGTIPAYNTNYTVENDSRCDCPQVIYALEEYAGRRVGYIREDRKDIIGVLLYQIMQKALGVSPSQYWGQLFQMMISEFHQKHILVYLHDDDAQKSLEALNFSGRMIITDNEDFLHINDANLGGAKSNMFIKHSIKQEFEKNNEGKIVKTLTVDYKNPSEGSKGCNLEAGGLCLNGLMPNWVRIYVPLGSQLIDFTGSEDSPVVTQEYGKTVFEGFLTVKPESVSQLKVKYQLPEKYNKNFSLYLQKQAGTDGHEFTTVINGEEVDVFNLSEDKKIDINL